MDLADSAITIAKTLYYLDVESVHPAKVILFDEIPLKNQLRYYSHASVILDELGAFGIVKDPDAEAPGSITSSVM